jgi:UPF0271 protein
MVLSVDLNCDMGESFGAWTMGNDAALMDHVSSINIACGFHAGDATTMRKTIETALEKGVAIGAHPGYPDLQGFGRRQMSLAAGEIRDIVMYQVAAIKGVCEALGGHLHHVKPHGAMYNFAAKNADAARAIAEAVRQIDPELILFGLSGSEYISIAEGTGLRCSSEVFADRTYVSDGSLTPRTEANALIGDTSTAMSQVLQMIKAGTVTATDGTAIPIRADTICIHGDGAHALEFASAIRQTLAENNIQVRPL